MNRSNPGHLGRLRCGNRKQRDRWVKGDGDAGQERGCSGELSWRGLEPANLLKVCSCGHVDDCDRALVESRHRYLVAQADAGLEIVVAHSGDRPLGFAETVPIEGAARDVDGEEAILLHCVNVFERDRGVGRALVEEALGRAARRGRGIVVDACADVWGFMPEEFFSRLGFGVAQARGRRRLMHAGLPAGARLPRYLEPHYAPPPPHRLAAGRATGRAGPGEARPEVVVDVFFTPLCGGLLSKEVAVMRRAAEPYGDRVLVREWSAGDAEVRRAFGIARAVFVNGVMRPNGDTIGPAEAAGLIAEALNRFAPATAVWDDSISRLF